MAKTDETETEKAPAKKKGGMVKILMMLVALLVVAGGSAGGVLYAMQAGLIGGGAAPHKEEVKIDKPRLIPKSEQKRVGLGEGEAAAAASTRETPMGVGGDKYASNYYAMQKEFTSNLRDSIHFIQVGIAISTPYDERVVENIKTHEIAVRSAILMALGDASEEQVFAVDGKRALQIHLVHAINDVLKQKEGFGGVGNVYFTTFVVQ